MRHTESAVGMGVRVAASVAVLLATSATRAEDPPVQGLPADAALAKRVAAAREAGLRWLRTQLAPDGSFKIAGSEHACPAETAFFAYVLRSAGAPRGDGDLLRAMQRVREDFRDRRARNTMIGHETYGCASVLLLLERVASDMPGDPPRTPPLSDADRALAAECRKLLAGVQVGDGTFSYGIKASSHHDHSNTHWALLGLHAARLLGLPTDATVWRRAAEHLVREQEESGPKVPRFAAVGAPRDGYAPQADGNVDQARGWGYLDGGRATGSMTAACVASVAICRDALFGAGDLDRSTDARTARSLRDGLAWIDLHFAVEANPGHEVPKLPGDALDLLAGEKISVSGYQYDWLEALERSASFLRLRLLGRRDWFADTASYLMRQQAADGHWNLTSLDTCFALLTLSRTPWRIDERAWK
jgi:hypothetical protein